MKRYHKVYRVVDDSALSRMTFEDWQRGGGCGLSAMSSARVSQILGEPPVLWHKRRIGVIQRACIVAGREIARFAVKHLNFPLGSVQTEYEDGVRVVDDPVCCAIA